MTRIHWSITSLLHPAEDLSTVLKVAGAGFATIGGGFFFFFFWIFEEAEGYFTAVALSYEMFTCSHRVADHQRVHWLEESELRAGPIADGNKCEAAQ